MSTLVSMLAASALAVALPFGIAGFVVVATEREHGASPEAAGA